MKKLKRKPKKLQHRRCPNCDSLAMYTYPRMGSDFWRCGRCLYYYRRAVVR